MTVEEFIAEVQPYIGVRGYRLAKRVAVIANVQDIIIIAAEDSIVRGGDPVPLG